MYVWPGDSQGNYTPGPGSPWGWFLFWNVTQNLADVQALPPRKSVYIGDSAEFIMERPSKVGGGQLPLTNYGPWFWPTQMDCYANDSAGNARDFAHDHYYLYTLCPISAPFKPSPCSSPLERNSHISGNTLASWQWLAPQ